MAGAKLQEGLTESAVEELTVLYTISVLGSTPAFHLVYGSTTTTDNNKL